jgi:hypothetical protein
MASAMLPQAAVAPDGEWKHAAEAQAASEAEEQTCSRTLLASSAGIAAISPVVFVIFIFEDQSPRAVVEAGKDALLGWATAAVGCSLHIEASSRRWALYKTLNCVALLSTVVETWVTFVSEGAESVVCGVLQVAVLVLLATAGYAAQHLEDLARVQRRVPDNTPRSPAAGPRLPSPAAMKRAAAVRAAAGERAMVAFQKRRTKRGTTEELEGLAGGADVQAAKEGLALAP